MNSPAHRSILVTGASTGIGRAALARKAVRHASPVEIVARATVHAFTARRPRTRYCMGADSRMQRWISRLPDRWADALIAKLLRWS